MGDRIAVLSLSLPHAAASDIPAILGYSNMVELAPRNGEKSLSSKLAREHLSICKMGKRWVVSGPALLSRTFEGHDSFFDSPFSQTLEKLGRDGADATLFSLFSTTSMMLYAKYGVNGILEGHHENDENILFSEDISEEMAEELSCSWSFGDMWLYLDEYVAEREHVFLESDHSVFISVPAPLQRMLSLLEVDAAILDKRQDRLVNEGTEMPAPLLSCAYSPAEEVLLCGDVSGFVQAYDFKEDKRYPAFSTFGGAPPYQVSIDSEQGLVFFCNGQTVAMREKKFAMFYAGMHDRRLAFLDERGHEITEFHIGATRRIALNTVGDLMSLPVDGSGGLRSCTRQPCSGLSGSLDGQFAYVGSDDGTFAIFSNNPWKQINDLSLFDTPVRDSVATVLGQFVIGENCSRAVLVKADAECDLVEIPTPAFRVAASYDGETVAIACNAGGLNAVFSSKASSGFRDFALVTN